MTSIQHTAAGILRNRYVDIDDAELARVQAGANSGDALSTLALHAAMEMKQQAYTIEVTQRAIGEALAKLTRSAQTELDLHAGGMAPRLQFLPQHLADATNAQARLSTAIDAYSRASRSWDLATRALAGVSTTV